MASQDISQSTNTKVLIACLVISVVFVLFRIFARWFKVRKTPLEAEDLSILLALSSFAIMCALYLAAMPTLYNVEAIGAGEMAPYASLETDLVEMLKYFFVVQFFFWLTLWAVKFSLLFMVKKLTIGLPFYVKIWWVVVVFAFLTFVGCVVSQVTSCSSMSAWFTAGACETPRDAVAKAASLWYALAVDLITDLLIMVIPLRLLWNLQISTIEKSSIGLVFTVGIITMVFAIVRVVSLDASTSGGQVSTTWLILWAAIEGMVAIIVGCLPAFAIFVRGRVEVHRSRYANYNNSKSDPSSNVYSSGTKSRARTESVLLNEMEPVVGSRDGESKKNLVVADGAIFVTQGWSQKWHDGDSRDAKMERDRRLGSLSD